MILSDYQNNTVAIVLLEEGVVLELARARQLKKEKKKIGVCPPC